MERSHPSGTASRCIRIQCFNPFQGLWNVLTTDTKRLQYGIEKFQSLSGIMERSHEKYSRGKIRGPGFQSLSGIMERSHCSGTEDWNRLRWFQSLSGIMERSHSTGSGSGGTDSLVSIPFRDYGTFSLRHLAGLCRSPLVSIPFRDYGTFSQSPFRCLYSLPPGFNPFQGLWNVLT